MANYRYVIYCHTNKTNGKKYVGCTHLNPVERWGLNGCRYNKDTVFGKAISEYGWDGFTHEILEYGIIGIDTADELEKKYIHELDSMIPNGYNTEYGGKHGKDKINVRPKTGWHHSEETKQKIKASLKGNPKLHPMSARIKRSTPVDMIDIDGNIVKSFYGAADASRQTGISITSIVAVCHGRKRRAGGYFWKYKEVQAENIKSR